MAGTRVGAERGWAKRQGITIGELNANRAAGLSWCYLCCHWLPLARFGKDSSRPSGMKSVCKACCNHKHTAWMYKITVEQSRQLRSGKSICEICERPQKLEVDHNHNTGKVRGLLCSRCNGALGQFLDNIEMLKKAIAYLEEKDG